MPLHFFSIKAAGDNEAEQASLNAFLNQHRIVSVQKEFVADGVNSYWAIAVDFLYQTVQTVELPGNVKKSQVDYKELLSPEEALLNKTEFAT